MALGGKTIPLKLKEDAILEAVFEIRFETSTLPEILFGRLADHAPWKEFVQRRLPTYEIPAPLRQADPNLRYQPVFELAKPELQRAIRIGPQVVSYHQQKPYVGWKALKPELDRTIQALFGKSDGPTVRRLGLRYLNALRIDAHGIKSVSNLDLKLEIESIPVSGNVNINFTTAVTADTACTVRVATPEFVAGDLPARTSVYVDVDVFTKETFRTKDEGFVRNWAESAHQAEKEQFFRLLTKQTIDVLKEA